MSEQAQEKEKSEEPVFTFDIAGETFRRREYISEFHAMRVAKAEKTGKLKPLYIAVYDLFLRLVHPDDRERFEEWALDNDELDLEALGTAFQEVMEVVTGRPSPSAPPSSPSTTSGTGTSKVVSLSRGTVDVQDPDSDSEQSSTSSKPSSSTEEE